MEGILLIDKPKGRTSFSLIPYLRKFFGVKTIGHAGTLDPFATGVMIFLIGKKFTRMSNQFLNCDKEYVAEMLLGQATDTYDCEGQTTNTSPYCPTLLEVKEAIKQFQGSLQQTPPMFSAKKIGGKKLYELARKGKEVDRPAQTIHVRTTLIHYEYPVLRFHVVCSKGTYIRTLAHDLGIVLQSCGHLRALQRTRSGSYHLNECLSFATLQDLTPDQLTLTPSGLLRQLAS